MRDNADWKKQFGIFLKRFFDKYDLDYAGKSTASVQTEMSPAESDKMTQDLMRLVGAAIDEWANLYGMNNLPKKIIFQQALTILNAMNTLLFK